MELFLRPVDQAFRHPRPGIGVLFIRQQNRCLRDHLFHGVAGQGGTRGLCLILQGLFIVRIQLIQSLTAHGFRTFFFCSRGFARRTQDAGTFLLGIGVGLFYSCQKCLCVCRGVIRRVK